MTDPRRLVERSLAWLTPMQLDSGLFCTEVVRGDPEPRGVSLRYSLMVLIGLVGAERHGYETGFDLGRIHDALGRELDSPELQPGDLGLHLWADALVDGGREDELRRRLDAALAEAGGPAALVGMELAWIVQGLALRHPDAVGPSLEALLAREGRGGLLDHVGAGPRRRFGNFATQIYGVLALSTVGALELDGRALALARRVADRLLALQLDDGGWPWLYDARSGRVVERYEVYSVHQHAMAPMGLLALAEATGDDRYAEAAVRGLGWIDGRNELGLDMVDEEAGLIYRSIRRRRPWDRLLLYANTAGAAVARPPLPGPGPGVELNATCRPYELGWLVEAWAGREDVAG